MISALDVGLWADVDLHLTRWLEVRVGYRADLLGYEVDDALGNRAPATRASDDYIVGFRRSTMGLAHGPRISADVTPWSSLTLHASYGEGYRSPQARQLADAEEAPFTKVQSADLGARYSPSEALNLSLSAYQTNLSDDVAFEASEGRLERVGATRRRGGVVHLEARPWAGSVAAASVTYVDAELLEPPPATADEPNPPFEAGQNLPFVPAVVARLDLGVERELTQIAYDVLQARVGLGISALSARPLPFGDYAQPFALVDASLAFDWSRFTVGFELFNVMDTQYSATEYSYVSHWNPAQPPSRIPARHISAGAPRTIMGSLELRL